MNLKKAALASLLVSSMLVTLAGPIPAGAGTAQQYEQQQSNSKTIQIDQKLAAKLEKAVKQFAGKEIKLNLQDASQPISDLVQVKSVDGKYSVNFKEKTGEIITVRGYQSIDKISKEDLSEVLKVLKGLYPKKDYSFDKEVHVDLNDVEAKTPFSMYALNGKGFSAILMKNYPGWPTKIHVGAQIEVAKSELDPKLLEKAAEAVKTALGHNFDVTKAWVGGTNKKSTWKLKGGNITLSLDAKTGETEYIYDISRKQLMTNKEITEKEVKEIVAPIAKKLFNLDIQGLEVKWDGSAGDFIFNQKKDTKMTVALDADKNVVYMFSGVRMLLEDLERD
ncbi:MULTISPECIES: hypothetical protein [Paenibacillus]|uniref:PepSY domain-containing protein n=1 Tax=Paenibacillus alvei TaxID=44250 RepID=A0ABT4E9Y6_PAEAL|nr:MULTISPECIES: hypothetical protein [Paenibacillus]EPY12065.1 hypothetical protein PAAL66ix_14916 [Paenibacillus alvei A6-6i-x]MCY9529278.1 hypothetical protein [Paenibacillus alvei]SDF88280.1 hypothetical protein SAMN04488689_107341 [Paenibacillus sp. cl6col]